jgi:hypothetical protein
VYFAALWKIKLICQGPYLPVDPLGSKESGLEIFCSTSLDGCLSVRLEPQVNQITKLKCALHSVSVCLDLLLILCPLQVVLQFSEYILTLLNPILNHRSLAVTKDNLYKGERVIIIQGSQCCDTNRHMMTGVVAVFSQMKPPNPCLLLPSYIISEVAFHPFVDYFCLTISLRVVAGARG